PLVRRADLGDRPELARDLGLEAVALAAAHVGREPDGARLAGLEAHGGAGGDVEPHTLGALGVELQRSVGLEGMEVVAGLDGAVAGVGGLDCDGIAALVELDLAGSGLDFPWDHDGPQRIGAWTVTSLVPSGKVASTWISSMMSATPSITCSRRSTWAPACIRSATERPPRAPSTTKSVISAIASGWLSFTPRSRRRRATLAAMATRSLSFSRGVRFIDRFPRAASRASGLDYKRLHQTCQTRGRRRPRKSVRKRMAAGRPALPSPSSPPTPTPVTRGTPAPH